MPAELGDLEKLRGVGFTHVAVTESNYRRGFQKSLVPKEADRLEHEPIKNFQKRVFAEGELLFERPYGTVL